MAKDWLAIENMNGSKQHNTLKHLMVYKIPIGTCIVLGRGMRGWMVQPTSLVGVEIPIEDA